MVELTDEEQGIIEAAGELWHRLRAVVYADGHDPGVAEEDFRELTAAVHVIQRAVMAQAAARAHPKSLRPLGRKLPHDET